MLDLHGIAHEDVSNIVHKFINNHWSAGWTLRIITGQSSQMKDLVLRVVRLYEVEREEDPWNSGVIIVKT